MRLMARLGLLALFGIVVGLAGCNSSTDTIVVQGAGATFPAPVYKRWLLEFYLKNPNARISYQPIGSGAGERQFSSGLIDFGASDAAKSFAEKNKDKAIVVPLTAGSISVAYNVPGVEKPLRLSRTSLAELFLGVIKKWNDPKIQADNPGVQLPDLPVRVVRRAESSGTTQAFSSHLSAISPVWKSEVGAEKTVDKWKTGIGARGNAGVAATIKRTPGTVGYLETGYAKFTEIPSALLQNKAGNYVGPTPEAGQAALAGSKFPDNLLPSLPDPEAPQGYPIVTYTWVIAKKSYDDPKKAQLLREVFTYCLTEGQPMAAELGYIPLPKSVTDKVLKAVQEIRP
jgi:phosphate transport system substrate-binding protein